MSNIETLVRCKMIRVETLDTIPEFISGWHVWIDSTSHFVLLDVYLDRSLEWFSAEFKVYE